MCMLLCMKKKRKQQQQRMNCNNTIHIIFDRFHVINFLLISFCHVVLVSSLTSDLWHFGVFFFVFISASSSSRAYCCRRLFMRSRLVRSLCSHISINAVGIRFGCYVYTTADTSKQHKSVKSAKHRIGLRMRSLAIIYGFRHRSLEISVMSAITIAR